MSALLDTLTLFAPSYAATLGLGLVCAYLGLFCVLRRIVFTGVALAQLAAAGVAAAFFVADSPAVAQRAPALADLAARFGSTVGSLGLALLGALGLQARPVQRRVAPDALVGLAYAGASALAILLVWRSTRGLAELRNILAGEVLLSRGGELTSLWVGLAVVTAVHVPLRRQFLLVSYDPEFARALGLPERRYQLLFLGTLALAVALSLKAGGLLMVFAFLVLPPVTGLTLGRGLPEATALALAAAAASALVGFVAAIGLDLPVAPTVAVVQLLVLGLAALGRLDPRAGHAARAALLAGAAAALLAAPVTLLRRPATPEPGPGPAPAPAPPSPPADGHDHGAGSVDGALRQLAGGSSEERRLAAARLGQATDPRALEALLRALGDEDPRVADAAGTSLEGLAARPEVRARLAAHAEGPDPDLRVHAADAWLRLGDARGLEAYVRLLRQPDVPVLERERLAGALQALNGGDALGYDPFAEPAANVAAVASWDAWWRAAAPRLRWDRERRAFRLE